MLELAKSFLNFNSFSACASLSLADKYLYPFFARFVNLFNDLIFLPDINDSL